MFIKISPDDSNHVFGISVQAIDSVDLHFLQTSESIGLVDFVRLMNHAIKMDEDMLDHDFSLVKEFGPVQIGHLRISDQYFEYFKNTAFVGFEGSIAFFAEACMPAYERMIVWPLLSDNIYLLPYGMVHFEDKLPFYEQTIELGSKSKVIECEAVDGGKIPYVEKVSFSRVYRTGKRKFWSRNIQEVCVLNDLVLYEGWKQSNPSERWLIKRQTEEPMWLVRHQDGVEFLEEPRRFVGMTSC